MTVSSAFLLIGSIGLIDSDVITFLGKTSLHFYMYMQIRILHLILLPLF